MSLSNSPASAPEPTAAIDSSGHFSSIGDLVADIASNYGVLFFTFFLLLGLAAAAAAEFLSNRRRRHGHPDEQEEEEEEEEEEEYDPRKAEVEMATMQVPTVLFSKAMTTKLNGFAAECSICLTEFAEGDALRVLPACSHGFHRQCVDRWLVAKRSCPNCRRACGGAQPHCLPDDALPV